MTEEAFNEIIDNFEVVAYLTEYGRRGIKENVKKLQKENKGLEKENQRLKAKIDVVNWQEKTPYQCLKEKYIPKQKIKEILNNKCLIFFEGDTEFPDDYTKINEVKYIEAKDLEELLQESEDK